MTAATASLRLLVVPGADTAGLCGESKGASLAAALATREPPVALHVRWAPDTADALASALESPPAEPVDVVLLSLAPLLDLAPGPAAALVRRYVAAAKETQQAHVLAVSACTALPGDDVSCYRGVAPTPAERIARLDLELYELSHAVGLGIVDGDRILSNLGAADHVAGPLIYSPEAAAALRDETMRVLLDYGFLDDRPLLRQVGARRARR